jgi:group I intron endonuclease
MSDYMVYWYHLSTHTDPYSQGYIGVTKQNSVRRRCHINGVSGGSRILCNAFKKYGIDNIIQDVLHTVQDKETAYLLEQQYRPTIEIGWNIAIGGGLPPDTTGRIDSQEIRDKRNASVRKAKAGKHYLSVFKGMTNRHSEESRKAIGDFHRGKVISESHKKAITEKMSGGNSPMAKEIHFVHKDFPDQVHTFPCIKTAADTLNIPYNALRSLAQRTLRNNKTSEPSRSGWICLASKDVNTPVDAVNTTIANRLDRFRKMINEREANRLLKGTGVTPSINK